MSSLTGLIVYVAPRFSGGHRPDTVIDIETFLFPATRAFRLVLLRGWEGVKETFTRATSARREKPVADREFSHGGMARRRTIARINFLRRLRLPRCRCSHAAD